MSSGAHQRAWRQQRIGGVLANGGMASWRKSVALRVAKSAYHRRHRHISSENQR